MLYKSYNKVDFKRNYIDILKIFEFVYIFQVSIETDRTVLSLICQNVMKEHSQLKGMKINTAVYQFLKQTSELEDFGMEQYFVKNRLGETLRLGVGPVGILIHDLSLQLKHR